MDHPVQQVCLRDQAGDKARPVRQITRAFDVVSMTGIGVPLQGNGVIRRKDRVDTARKQQLRQREPLPEQRARRFFGVRKTGLNPVQPLVHRIQRLTVPPEFTQQRAFEAAGAVSQARLDRPGAAENITHIYARSGRNSKNIRRAT